VEEWVLTGFSRQSEQMCSEGRPRWFAGEFGDDLVGLAVEHLNDPGANPLLGGDMEPVGVALDRIMQLRGWVAEAAEECGGRGRCVVASEDLFEQFGRGAGGEGFGSDEGVRVAVADDRQV
jgi:hypothetical protein